MVTESKTLAVWRLSFIFVSALSLTLCFVDYCILSAEYRLIRVSDNACLLPDF